MASVDIAFPIVGSRVPRDHGYAVYGALCRRVPGLHGAPWLGVHPISGTPANGHLILSRGAHLSLRVPANHIVDVLPLAGAVLDLKGSHITIGVPRVHPLVPAPSVDARLVLVKVTRPDRRINGDLGRETFDTAALADRYEAELRRQLAKLDIDGELSLCGRQRMTVAGRRIIGYSVRVRGLNAAASILLQEAGLGGRRAMGCGVFRPTRDTGRGRA